MIQGDLNGDPVPEAIEIHAHGSDTAFLDLKAGGCDIGMSSREVKPEEVNELHSLGQPDLQLDEHVVALDGIAVIVHKSNHLKTLTIEQVATVFGGKITRWSQLGGSPTPISLYARDHKSGTYEFFRQEVLLKYGYKEKEGRREDDTCGKELSLTALCFEDSTQLSEKVAQDGNAIGFIGMPYIGVNNALALHEQGTLPLRPTTTSVKTQDYPLSRRLYFYTMVAPTNPHVREFIKFALDQSPKSVATQAVNEAKFVSLRPECTLPDATDPRAVSNEWRRLTRNALEISTRFRFKKGQSELDTLAAEDIRRVAKIYGEPECANGYGSLLLIGFADRTGPEPFNIKLSRDRVTVVQRELAAEGLTINNIVGLGSEAPVAFNDPVYGNEKNRRVEVWVRR